jgi:hypothetical protein
MSADRLFNVLGSIVTVALVTTIVSSKNTAGIVSAFGNAFAGSLKAAQGH